LKCRQVQLFQSIEEARRQNELLRMSLGDLERKYEEVVKQLDEARVQIQENSDSFAQEKSELINQYQKTIDDLV